VQVWTFLHIVAMFAAVSLVVGGEIFALEAGRRRDVGALRAYFRLSSSLERLSTLALVAGIAFGLTAAVVGGLNLLQGWLVLAYVLVAGGIVVGAATAPAFNRLRVAVETNRGDDAGPELDQLLKSPLPYLLVTISIAFLVAIVWVMVFKPTF
jgi:uncharacterized membrane protein